MPSNLFSLTYRSGFQRDGTIFQSKYCTDGQWVRFQRGHIKKIGGMNGIFVQEAGLNGLGYPSSMLVIPYNSDVIVILGTTTFLYTYKLTQNWLLLQNSKFGLSVAQSRTVQSIVIDNKTTTQQSILWMATNNLTDINDNSPPTFYTKDIDKLLTLGTPTATLQGVDKRSNGGMCFISQRLFLYGANGFVQWSSTDDPFNFEGPDGGSQRLPTTDKIIYAASTRGGSVGTSLLFWSLSSVIRGTNAGTPTFSLATDVISSSSSIMSSKSVVEYDGLFFWAGIDRFFVYNGIVTELPNPLNLNYFFDNVDFEQREKVFGIKNTKYGEIWWFYCDKRDRSTVPTRAIIFNKRENCWYDTSVSRTAGYFSNSLGFMMTVGRPLANPGLNDNNYLWLHEQRTDQFWAERVDPIQSSFTTPTISWAAFPPGGGDQPTQLLERWLTLSKIEPDFVRDNNAPIFISITALTQRYAQSVLVAQPITDKDGNTPILIGNGLPPNNGVSNGVDVINFNVETRNISFQFASVQNFEVGNIHFVFGIGEGQ